MKLRIVTILIAALGLIESASAQDFPRHNAICVDGIVSKPKLASSFLNADPKWQAIYQGTLQNDDAYPSKHQPRWQGIFLESPEAFCKNNPACLGPDPDAKSTTANPPQNYKAAIATIRELRLAFENA